MSESGPNRPFRFRELPTGSLFRFSHGENEPQFRKVSAECYVKLSNNGTYTIGSGGAIIIPTRASASVVHSLT